MIFISLMFLVACAGSIYATHLMKQEKAGRVASLIQELERESGAITVDPEEQEAQRGPLRRLAKGLKRFMPATLMDSYGERLLWTGRPYGLDAGQFISLKVVSALLLPAVVPVITLFQLGSMTFSVMALAAVLGFTLPDVWLSARLADRRRQVAEELPLFTDLIATAINAGLSLTEAVRRVAADAPGLVAREFLRSVQEMAAGKPRMQAWRDLMNRVPGDELRTIVNAVMQAEQYGTSVSEILRYQVQQIRMFKQAIHCSKILVEMR